jgi:ActR/RegA family two-component response regulator
MLKEIRVLIVEDEVIELNRLERSLKRINPALEISKASSAEQSLSAFRESNPDVVILDLGLSESGPQSGLDLIPKFKDIDSNA